MQEIFVEQWSECALSFSNIGVISRFGTDTKNYCSRVAEELVDIHESRTESCKVNSLAKFNSCVPNFDRVSTEALSLSFALKKTCYLVNSHLFSMERTMAFSELLKCLPNGRKMRFHRLGS
jgi:hypothetical protein